MLDSIKKWPGFSLLNPQQTSQQAATSTTLAKRFVEPINPANLLSSSSRRASNDTPPPPPPPQPILPNQRLISSTASVGSHSSRNSLSPNRHSRPVSAPRGVRAIAGNASAERNPNTFSRNSRSSSAGRMRGRNIGSSRDDANESIASFSSHGNSVGSRNSHGQNGSRTFGPVAGQTWDVDAVQEVRTRGAAAFAEGEELLKIIHTLCEVYSVAHTKLLLRLIGFCGDLVKLRTMAEFSGRMTEATRLAVLCGCVESTVDADSLDPSVFGGRSRKRLVQHNFFLSIMLLIKLLCHVG